MKKAVLSLLLLCLFFPIFSVEGDDKEKVETGKALELDVDTAVSLALANNLALKQEKLKFTDAKWAMYTSWNTFVPSITMSGTMVRSNLSDEDRKISSSILVPNPLSEIAPGAGVYEQVAYYNSELTRNQWSVSAAFSLDFNFNAAMVFGVYQTVLGWQSGKLSLEMAEKNLRKDVMSFYYNLILMEKNVELLKANLASAESRYRQAVINYNNGLVPKLTRLSAEVGYESIKPGLAELENGLETMKMQFILMLGLKSDVELNLVSELESPTAYELDVDELIDNYIERRLEIQALKMGIKSMENGRNMRISALTPSFSMGFSMDPSYTRDPIDPDLKWFRDADDNFTTEYWKQQGGMLRLTMAIPLSAFVPFSKEQMAIVSSTNQIQRQRLALESLKQMTELEIKKTVMKLEQSVKSIKALRLTEEVAKEAYALATAAYNAGTKDALDVEEEENKLNKAIHDRMKAEYNYTVAILELEYILDAKITDIINKD